MNPLHDPTDLQYPLPEAIKEGEWDVRHGPPAVSIENRVLSVPLDNTPRSYHIRRHEIGRAHWYPMDPGNIAKEISVTPRTVLAVQDAIINRTVANNGDIGTPVYTDNDEQSKFLAGRIKEIPDLKNRILSALSLASSTCYPIVHSAMDPREKRVLDQVEVMLHHSQRRPPDDGSMEEACRWLEAMFEQMQDGKMSGGHDSAMDLHDLAKEIVEQGGSEQAQKEAMGRHFFGDNPGLGDGEGKGWYDVQWHFPPLTQRLPGRKMGRKKYAQDYGACPRRMNRWAIDQRIFDRVVKGPGGAILIDASGSMSFTSLQVYTIMAAAPNCTVAMYFGGRDPNNESAGKYGHIVLLADKGKCVTEEVLDAHRWGGDNACDGVGLKWLATKGKPRIWVSDGYVTGRGGMVMDLIYECAATCRDGNIKRIATMDRAVKFFTRGMVQKDTFRDTAIPAYEHEPMDLQAAECYVDMDEEDMEYDDYDE